MHQIYSPKLTSMNKLIIIAAVTSFFLIFFTNKIFGLSLEGLLGLSAAGLSKGYIFQLLTYPLVGNGLLGLLFECLIIWFIGSDLESIWGEKTYLKFFLASIFGSALVFLLLSFTVFKQWSYGVPLMGLAGFGYSLCLAYAIIYSERYLTFMLIFPIKAKWFCVIMVAILAYTGLSSPQGASSWGHLAAMLAGYIYLKNKANAMAGKGPFQFLKGLKRKKRSPGLYIVPKKGDDDDNPPTYH